MEFEKTDSSKLTIEEFDTKHIDLEQEMDPPCYTEGLRKAKLAQVRLQYLWVQFLLLFVFCALCGVNYIVGFFTISQTFSTHCLCFFQFYSCVSFCFCCCMKTKLTTHQLVKYLHVVSSHIVWMVLSEYLRFIIYRALTLDNLKKL